MASLILQSKQSQTASPSRGPSGVKSVLLHIQDDEGLEARLQAGLGLVRASGGHLSCLQVTPPGTFVGFEAFGAGYVTAELITQLENQEAALRSRIEARLAKEDVVWSYEHRSTVPSRALVDVGALADLIVVGRSAHYQSSPYRPASILAPVLQSSHTPVLICPNELARFDPFGVAVIAWNGSFEAANALRAALPLLGQASAVFIVTVDDDRHYDFPQLDAAEYLSRHGIKADLVSESRGSLAVADRIIATANELDAAYAVMGAYGHSRAREYLFGGVTRSVLKECPLPLIMSR